MYLVCRPRFGRREWTKEEIEILKKYYPVASWDTLLRLLPNRSKSSIVQKACQLGLTRTGLARCKRKSFDSKLLRGEATPFEIGFIVGLIEGEGTFNLKLRKNRKHAQPRFTISNTDLRLLKYAQSIIGGRIRKQRVSKRGTICYALEIAKIDAIYKTLEKLIPYLITKKKQAKVMYEYCKLRLSMPCYADTHPKEKELYNRLHQLNSAKKYGQGLRRNWRYKWERWE